MIMFMIHYLKSSLCSPQGSINMGERKKMQPVRSSLSQRTTWQTGQVSHGATVEIKRSGGNSLGWTSQVRSALCNRCFKCKARVLQSASQNVDKSREAQSIQVNIQRNQTILKEYKSFFKRHNL